MDGSSPAAASLDEAVSALTPANEAHVGPRRRAIERFERTADVIVDLLVDAGVEAVFGLPGGAISPVFDALLDRPGIRLVTTKHEAGAIFAAIGYARATGKLGVVLVTSGPGILNTLTGLASAQADGVPILVLAGEVARASQGRGGLQEGSAHALNVVGITGHVCKMACEVPAASAAPNLVRRAIAAALSGRQGPTMLSLPLDITSQKIRAPKMSQASWSTYEIDPVALEWTTKALVRSRRKVIFAGSGVRHGRGPELLRALAERLCCPVITTPKGKGVFPESHPLALGVFGIGGHPTSSAYLEKGAETVLAIGTSLGDLATNGWSDLLAPTRTLIHVDIDPAQIGRSYEPQLAITAPAEQFIEELLQRVAHGTPTEVSGVAYHTNSEERAVGEDGAITPQRAIWELQSVLPEDTIYSIDSGEHNVFAIHYVAAERPDTFMVMTGVGAMGSSIPAALGAQLADPARTVAVICGDGGYAMCAPEIATAAQHGLPLVIAVFNDQRLGMVEIGHRLVYGRTPSFELDPLDVGAMGAALGADILTVRRPDELLQAASTIAARVRPLVIDIRISKTESMPRNARTKKLVEDMGWPGAPRRRGPRSES